MSSKLGTNTVPGYIDHLGIITNQGSEPGEISLTDNSIIYLPQDKTLDDEIVTISNSSSRFKSIKCSDLTKALSAKSFFKEGLTYVEQDDSIKLKLNPNVLSSGEIPNIIHPLSADVSKFSDGIKFNNKISTTDALAIQSRYEDLYEGEDRVGFDFMKSAVDNGVDLTNRPLAIVIIAAGSDVYTDTVNFNGIIRHSVCPSLGGSVDIDVRYSTTPGRIYTYNIVFPLFNYSSNLTLNIRSFIQDIDSKVQVEFIDGVLKVFPTKSDINECIINSCILTYAKS